MITRERSIEILSELGNSPNMVKHAIAAEEAMKALHQRFGEKETQFTEEDWGVVGLLHDADYEATNKNLATHTDLVTEKLKALAAKQEIIDAIAGHCDKAERKTYLAKAIYAADELTGLIVATALVMPNKKLASVTPESVLKKFRDHSFAKGANRAMILTCEKELEIPLPEFVEIVLKSMQEISDNLGL